MKTLLNKVVDGKDRTYELFLEINKSSLKNHFDIRFFSKFSASSNPDSEQTKWKTTIPKESIENLISSLKEELNNG